MMDGQEDGEIGLERNLYWICLRRLLAPLLPLLDDPAVSEVMINGSRIYYETRGHIHPASLALEDTTLLAVVRSLAQFVGKEIQPETTHMAARLPDGSRVQVVLPPCSRSGILISIRKFSRHLLGLKDLIALGSLTPAAAQWLEILVGSKKNVIVSGGTGSGKTSLLNILGAMTAATERLLVLEDTQELQIHHNHCVSMEARPAQGNPPRGAVTLRDLVMIALRMRPDRIVVGEVRGGEALDLLQAMATGHSGSMSTLHANEPVGALRRLETLATFGASGEIPIFAIRSQVAESVEVVVQVNRFSDGSRRVTHISEVLPLDLNANYVIRDIFTFVPEGKDGEGRIQGRLRPTGQRSRFLEQMQTMGYTVPMEIFSND